MEIPRGQWRVPGFFTEFFFSLSLLLRRLFFGERRTVHGPLLAKGKWTGGGLLLNASPSLDRRLHSFDEPFVPAPPRPSGAHRLFESPFKTPLSAPACVSVWKGARTAPAEERHPKKTRYLVDCASKRLSRLRRGLEKVLPLPCAIVCRK